MPLPLLRDVLGCQGSPVETGQLTRLRRAEERAFRHDPSGQGPWLAPAISSLDLTAIPGTLTRSAWPLEQRIVGLYTPRTRHLRVLLALVDGAVLGGGADPERVERLIARFAESVPGAVDRGQLRDAARVQAAAKAELGPLEPLDGEERQRAAARLAELALSYQVWGQPAVLASGPELPVADEAREAQP